MTEKPDVKKILRAFYADYAQWLDAGAESPAFNRSAGLCSNLQHYCKDFPAVLGELSSNLVAAGLDDFYPFNGGPVSYKREVTSHTCHLNPARVNWVRRQLSNEARQ